jgi:hypothetical protein
MTNLVNFLLYQLGWFACVLGVASGLQWLGIGLALGLVAVHLWLAKDRVIQFRLMGIAFLLGLFVDTVLLRTGVFFYPSGQPVAWLPPPCMPVLWLQFATIFRYCLHWLKGRFLLSGLFGLIGAPLAFLAGESFGAIEFPPPSWLHIGILGVVWSLCVPFLVCLADRLPRGNGSEPGYRGIDPESIPAREAESSNAG